jgi:hypothetical protein
VPAASATNSAFTAVSIAAAAVAGAHGSNSMLAGGGESLAFATTAAAISRDVTLTRDST